MIHFWGRERSGQLRRWGWAGAAVFAAALVAYLPCLRGGVLWNDPDYLTRPELRSLHGLWRIWFEVGATQQYYPLLHSAFWLEHRLWGDSMLGYHLVNVALHAGVACLLGLTMRRLLLPGAFLAAMIFAVHPVFVESVAWVTEQKNTLSGVFFFAAALAYLRWREPNGLPAEPAESRGRPGRYLLALLLFVAAVLSKTTTAPLPAVLLVIFWWQRGRIGWKADVVPLLPWFAIGAGEGLFSAWVERTYVGANGAAFALSLGQRALVAGRAAWFYLGKLLWPSHLVFIYPRWNVSTVAWWQFLFPLAALALLAALWIFARKNRGPLAAILIFGGLLFPVMGFFNLFAYMYSFVADHFQYLPAAAIVVFVAALWGGATRTGGALARGFQVAVVALLGLLSWQQSRAYTDIETFYRTIIARNPECWMAYNNLGNYYRDQGRAAEAMAEYQAVSRLKPGAEAEFNLGIILADTGRSGEAIDHYREALRLRPDFPGAAYNLGLTLASAGRMEEAIDAYRDALRHEPNFSRAHSSLGLALAVAGQLPEAIAECEAAVRGDPDLVEARFNLGFALAAADRSPEAIPQYEAALQINPDFPEAHNNLGLALVAAGRLSEAEAHYRKALWLRPNYAAAHKNLGIVLGLMGNSEASAAELREAARLRAGLPR